MKYTLYDIEQHNKDLYDFIIALLARERQECAEIAQTAGLGEPHSMPPYNVRDMIAHAIRSK
jgi:hypothetical protein